MKKVIEVIKLKHWIDNSGFTHEETYSDDVIEVSNLEEPDWTFWECGEVKEGEDLLIKISYYSENDEERKNSLAEYEKWESELRQVMETKVFEVRKAEVDSSAFNDIIKAFLEMAVKNADIDEKSQDKVKKQIHWIFDEKSAKEVLANYYV